VSGWKLVVGAACVVGAIIGGLFVGFTWSLDALN
jgi:hypothetical protein